MAFRLITTACTALVAMALSAMAHAAEAETDQECLEGFLETGADDLTLGEMRRRCVVEDEGAPALDEQPGVVERRLAEERKSAVHPFSILAHKPNYILPVAYNFDGWNPPSVHPSPFDPGYEYGDWEAQFQFSFKVPLAIDLFGGRMDLYAAYTNRSFWQMYNRENSEPFRESDHEPAVFVQFRNDWEMLGFRNAVNAFGWAHQSNGQVEPLSRSWNRLYANFLFEREDLVLSLKPWIWVSKDRAESDNPDITDYMGHGEFRAVWRKNANVFSLMLRNQIESGFDRGALELAWSFPVFDYPYLKGYAQYFYGYGESLIDYNQKVNRIGIGISITDWLE